MGWKLDLKLRAELLLCATEYNPVLPAADTVLIDGPATFRSGAVGARPPRQVIDSVLTILPSTARSVAIFFDCPTMVPATRRAVHTSRSAGKAETTISDVVLRNMTTKSLGKHPSGAEVTWPELFSSTRGKAAAYAILFLAVKESVLRTCQKTRITSVTCPATGALWSHPFHETSPFTEVIARHAYGEAECQLAMCISSLSTRAPAAPALVMTIDTDILLQVAATPAIPSKAVTIALARVWRNPENIIIRTAAAGRKRKRSEKFSQQWELIDCGKLPAGSPDQLFWYLAAGGVDYCNGLGGFGWPQRNCINTASSTLQPLFSRPGGGDWVFDLRAFVRHLIKTRKSRRKNAEVDAFCRELDSILYCWRYYMWHDARRPERAGPLLEQLVPRHSAGTVDAWLLAASAAGGATKLPETWPGA